MLECGTLKVGLVLSAVPMALHASTPHVLPLRINVSKSSAPSMALTTSTAVDKQQLWSQHKHARTSKTLYRPLRYRVSTAFQKTSLRSSYYYSKLMSQTLITTHFRANFANAKRMRQSLRTRIIIVNSRVSLLPPGRGHAWVHRQR